jgi:cytochrome P450/NADPH-cytochrome P450 reductase
LCTFQWNAVFAFPRYCHARLLALGATPIHGIGLGDVNTPVYEEVFTKWTRRMFPALLLHTNAKRNPLGAPIRIKPVIQVSSGAPAAAGNDPNGPQVYAPKLLINALDIDCHTQKVTESRELHTQQSPFSTRHIELTLPANFQYKAGDHLGVCPKNSLENVKLLASLFTPPIELASVFMLPKNMKERALPREVPLQVLNVLTSCIDISMKPSLALITLMLAHASTPEDLASLTELRKCLAHDTKCQIMDEINNGRWNVISLLQAHKSVKISFFDFLECAHAMRPRYYSISSSPQVHGNKVVHATIGRLMLDVPGAGAQKFYGLSSNYVQRLRAGDEINIFLDGADGFHMQDDLSLPMIFVSAGTGYAPMRAFLFERQALHKKKIPMGAAMLINGIRNVNQDFIYRDEIESAVSDGYLQHAIMAYSRDDPEKREYVQHKIIEHGSAVWNLMDAGAYIYVCGSESMRASVMAAFTTVVQHHGRRFKPQAEQYMKEMESVSHKYRPDVWG